MKLVCVVLLACLGLSYAFSVLPEVEYEEAMVELSVEVDYDQLLEGCPLEAADKVQFWDIWKIIRKLHRLSECQTLFHRIYSKSKLLLHFLETSLIVRKECLSLYQNCKTKLLCLLSEQLNGGSVM